MTQSTLVRTALHIDAPQDDVFDALADPESYADWVVGAKEVRRADDDFPSRGADLHHTVGVLAFAVRDRTRVVRAMRPRLLELDARVRVLRAAVRFELEPDDTGTTVVMEEQGSNALSRALTWLGRPVLDARNAQTLWRLRRRVEGAPRSATRRRLEDATVGLFGLGASLRRGRALHPRGVTRTGRATLTADGRLLADRADPDVVVRFSRGAGMPARLPDVNGIAIRLIDARGGGRHRDLLLSGAGTGLLRRVLRPTVDFGRTHFSSLAPYELAGRRVTLAADVAPTGLTLDSLRAGAPATITLFAASARGREPLATVSVGALVDGRAIRFSPTEPDDRLVAVGLLNSLRPAAYAASQAVRRGERDPQT